MKRGAENAFDVFVRKHYEEIFVLLPVLYQVYRKTEIK